MFREKLSSIFFHEAGLRSRGKVPKLFLLQLAKYLKIDEKSTN